MPLIYIVGKILMSKDLMEFIWQDFGFRYISKNQVLGRKKSVEDVVTLGPTAQATLVNNR